MKHSPGRRPHHLGVECVDAARPQHHTGRPHGLGAAHDGAQIARVVNSIQKHHPRCDNAGGCDFEFGQRRHAPRHQSHIRLWRFSRCHALKHTFAKDKHGRIDTVDGCCVARNKLRQHIPAATNGLSDEHGTLNDEETFVKSGRSAREQAPQLLNTLVRKPQRFVQASAALAVSTSFLKVASSVMARSASTLRSTSTPALCRPSMKRLYDMSCTRQPALMR